MVLALVAGVMMYGLGQKPPDDPIGRTTSAAQFAVVETDSN